MNMTRNTLNQMLNGVMSIVAKPQLSVECVSLKSVRKKKKLGFHYTGYGHVFAQGH